MSNTIDIGNGLILQFTKKSDETVPSDVWVQFHGDDGKSASISIAALAERRGVITSNGLRSWAGDRIEEYMAAKIAEEDKRDAAKSKDELTLKWGTLKAWDFTHNEKALELMKRYSELGCSAGAMQQRDTPEQKDLICQMIGAVDCEIYLDWDGKYVSKDEAKAYVMEPRG